MPPSRAAKQPRRLDEVGTAATRKTLWTEAGAPAVLVEERVVEQRTDEGNRCRQPRTAPTRAAASAGAAARRPAPRAPAGEPATVQSTRPMLRTESGPSYQPAQSGSVHAARPGRARRARAATAAAPTPPRTPPAGPGRRPRRLPQAGARPWRTSSACRGRVAPPAARRGAGDRRPHHGPSDGGHDTSWHPMPAARHCGWHGCRQTRAGASSAHAPRSLACSSALLLAGCTPAAWRQVRRDGPVITLTVATSDQPGGPQAPALEHFAEAVATSRGAGFASRRPTPPRPRSAKFDQVVAGRVQDGTSTSG